MQTRASCDSHMQKYKNRIIANNLTSENTSRATQDDPLTRIKSVLLAALLNSLFLDQGPFKDTNRPPLLWCHFNKEAGDELSDTGR